MSEEERCSDCNARPCMCAGPSILATPPGMLFGGPFRQPPRLRFQQPRRFWPRPRALGGTTPRLTLDFGDLFDGSADIHTHRGPAGRVELLGNGWAIWVGEQAYAVSQALSLEMWGRRLQCDVDGEAAVAWIGRDPWVLLPSWEDAASVRSRATRRWQIDHPAGRIGLLCSSSAKRIDVWSQPRIQVVLGVFLGLAMMKMAELQGWLREPEELG